ncbi:uncharacterized protein H6S33_008148 [Morchella sextelata]|uniref:uncharacterized protein n=1 Tax=Morchella sextelata TaxID=1174677 RepID=UPI001D0517FB|nr:uncharacterized protein H6S33_008148 [Morchella sextelata]KAH0603144.1 hypothetical protein H6S33_008148 [Morchella sextelata]
MPRNRGDLWMADNCALVIIRLDALMIHLKAKIACCKQELKSGRCGPPHGFLRGFNIQEIILRSKMELDGHRHLKYHLFYQQMMMQLSTAEYEALPEYPLSDDSESDNEEDNDRETEDDEMVGADNENEEGNDEEQSDDEEMDDAEIDEEENDSEQSYHEEIDNDDSGDYEPMDEDESDEEE